MNLSLSNCIFGLIGWMACTGPAVTECSHPGLLHGRAPGVNFGEFNSVANA